jgi:probable FeS assembly SUF system protein SufT
LPEKLNPFQQKTMHNYEETVLTRDVEGILIPIGDRVTLLAGEPVTITQALGGSFTVMIRGNLARIDAKDADALGKEIATGAETRDAEGPVEESALWEVLKTCYDPEIPVNIVDLGLIYDLHITPLPEGGNRVDVKMTLTAPGCGMGPVLASDVEQKVSSLPGVREANVELVWDPPWGREMMSEAAKLQLGMM